MDRLLHRLIHEEEAQGMMEYALIIAFVAAACIGVWTLFGEKIMALIKRITGDIPD